MLHRIISAAITELGPLDVEIRMMTGGLGRDGHVIEPAGAVLTNYARNPIQLWQHNHEAPVGRNEDLRVDGEAIVCRTVFAPEGVSAKADEIRGLVKAGIINAVSIGFDVIEAEPLDPKRPRAGLHITRWELLECSFVSVPADPGAIVTARELAEGERSPSDWKCGAARDLPIEDSDAWDGHAAEASIFEHAGGEDFAPAKARRGFLAYDAAAPKLRGSYKLPIAHFADGELKVPKGAIRAAASRLPAAEIGGAKDEAQKVLDHYKGKAGIGEDKTYEEAPRAAQAAVIRAIAAAQYWRGMMGVAHLALVLGDLAAIQANEANESGREGDSSQVPTMLKAALASLGEALVAMTDEEVAELVAGDEDEGPMPMYFDFDAAPGVARMLMMRAGAAVSKASQAKLAEGVQHCDRGLEYHAAATQCRDDMEGTCAAAVEAMRKCRADHEKGMAALDAGDHEEAARCFGRCARNMDAVDDHHEALQDEHGELGDAHNGVARCFGRAKRCMRAVHDPETDTKEIQTSAGTDDSEGSENGRAHRLQQIDQRRAA